MVDILLKYHIIFHSIIVIAGAALLHWLLRATINRIINKLHDKGYQSTQIRFIKNSLGFVIYSIAIAIIVMEIPKLESLGKSLLAGAGILAAIIGFASQAAFSNIISGVFIIIFKPFQIDDTIELDQGLKGIVSDITFRHTVIKDFENRRIVIPNSKISEATVVNSSLDEEKIRKRINFTISYESDVDLARKIIIEEIEKHPNCIDNRKDEIAVGEENPPKVLVLMTAWQDSSINMRAWVWTPSNAAAFRLECDVLESIKKRFQAEGINIPYPQLRIHQ
jgi:small conductance mechanosensitive channel